MKKTLWASLVILGLVATLLATIYTDPSSGTAAVGQNMGFRLDCNNYSTANWYWGDGTSLLGVADDLSWRYHTYRNPGTYTVHMHRSNASYPSYCNGMNPDEYRTVTILENRSLTVSPANPNAGAPLTFTAVNFNTPKNIYWNMGDGTVYANQGATISHTYAKGGQYLVRAFDWNGDTKTTPVSLTVLVHEALPTIVYSPAMPRVDEEVAIQALNFKTGSIKWNFGDGTQPQVLSAAVAHRYQKDGTFTITARAEDQPAVTRLITILPENRSLSLSGGEARVDEPVTVTAVNFRGPQVLWDFGDGSTTATAVAAPAGGRVGAFSGPLTVSHAYKLPGNYVITARDENGASAKRFQTAVRILGISDQVNLELAEITLDNGKYYKVIPKNSKSTRAQLRLKMRGTGGVSGYWIVDGHPAYYFSETAYQGQVRTILTPEVPGLPTFDPGLHTLTVQLTRPVSEGAVFPTLRYFVLPYENVIATLSPKDGAVLKEDEQAVFSWERALGGTRYQIAFCNTLFPLLRNEQGITWRECPETLRYTPDAETWAAIPRNELTFWKVRALDSAGATLGESEIQELKVIVPGAEISIEKISDMDGNPVARGDGGAASRAERLMVYGRLTYPAEAEYLVLRVYAGEELVDQLLFRDVLRDEPRTFETSVPNLGGETLVTFQALKSSSPSVLVGYEELRLKRD